MTARNGRRVAVIAVVAVFIVGVGDRLLRAAAEERLARQTTCRLRAVDSSVSLGGLLLLPQIVRGRYSHVVIDSTGVPESGGPVDLTANLHDVRQIGHHELHAGHGLITVIVPFSTVSAQAGPGIKATESDGELAFEAVSGKAASYGATVFATVALDHHSLVVTPTQVAVAGKPVPLAKAKRIAARTGQSLAPHRTPLPTSLTSLGLTSATATDRGIVLSASGPNVTLTIPAVPGCS
jgi:LmeA-like phospholipid-binding